MRLQRYLADAGVAARRVCEQLIEDGHVEVNGRVVRDLPIWVDPEADQVRVEGKIIRGAERHVYVMLNKPKRTLTTASDELGVDRRTVTDLVDHPSVSRLFPVGRLDYDTVGLLLLTNDGNLANRLTHPRYGVAKTYRAVVKGMLEQEQIEQLEKGIYLAERREGQTVGATRTAHVGLRIIKRDRERTILEITLGEGRNRQVRRMLASVGCPVKKLERITMGPLKLKGLQRGAWRELTRDEVQSLRRAARGAKPTQAGETRSRRRRRRER